jgi:hypothetical protein
MTALFTHWPTLVTHWPLLAFAAEEEFDPNQVTPTWVGFGITLLLAVATVFLLIDMTRRVRRTRYRGEVREQLDAERAASEGDTPSEADK